MDIPEALEDYEDVYEEVIGVKKPGEGLLLTKIPDYDEIVGPGEAAEAFDEHDGSLFVIEPGALEGSPGVRNEIASLLEEDPQDVVVDRRDYGQSFYPPIGGFNAEEDLESFYSCTSGDRAPGAIKMYLLQPSSRSSR